MGPCECGLNAHVCEGEGLHRGTSLESEEEASLRSCGDPDTEHGSTKLWQEPEVSEEWQWLRKTREDSVGR